VVRAVRTLLSGGKLSDAGAELASYRPFRLEMKPVRADVPIYVAALKQKAIESIGECADGWMPTFWPYDRLAEGRSWIAAGAARAGRDPKAIVTAPFTSALPLAGPEGAQIARQIVSFYIGGMGDYYIELLSRFGWADACKRIADLYADKATRAQAADAVPDGMVEALTIAGDPQHCLDELRRRRSFGVDLPILNLPPNVPWEMVEAFIRAMAPG
jgi:alkanesulfonate monooxygenase SsuD/methylene tetrahydromethanopterin reductase-like flavin-dependent oxidoreductase (luciferase family)